MNLLKKLFTATVILFLFIGCDKKDDIKSTDLTINLNPGQGLTVSELDGLAIGIVRLPEGTTKNDDLDYLQWTREPEWIMGTSNNEGKVVFNDIDAGLYLIQMNDESMRFETFSVDVTDVFIQTENGKSSNQHIGVVLKEADNLGFSPLTLNWPTEKDSTLTAYTYCYNEDNDITETLQIETFYAKNPLNEAHIVSNFRKTINDMYDWKGIHHNLRDKYHKIKIDIINNNDGSTVSRTIYPAGRTWSSKEYIDSEKITIGNKTLILDCIYDNTLGSDVFIIEASGWRN